MANATVDEEIVFGLQTSLWVRRSRCFLISIQLLRHGGVGIHSSVDVLADVPSLLGGCRDVTMCF